MAKISKTASGPKKRASGPTTLKALFIGNSFTARNDLPAMVAEMAASIGATLNHRLISAGGASLRRHYNGGEAIRAIKSGSFDFVVLQEQSTLPFKSASRMHENVRLFDETIKAAGAKMVLYLTWARKGATTQQAITDAYSAIGREVGALVAPAGEAWSIFMKKHDASVLHDRDGSHPTVAGTYLAACTIFSTLFGHNSSGISAKVEGLTDAEMKQLQAAADAAISEAH